MPKNLDSPLNVCWVRYTESMIPPMNGSITPSRDQLRRIARRAMLERGLLPDFSGRGCR